METLQSTIFIEFDVNTKKITFLRGDGIVDYDSNVTSVYVRVKYKNLSGNTVYLTPSELEGYKFSLYTIKPATNNINIIIGEVTDELKENVYGGVVKFEIPRACTNRLGIVKCEIHINQEDKIIGSSTFVLDVKQSLVTAFDDELLGDEDFPILKQLILEIQKASNIDDNNISEVTTYSSDKIEDIKEDLSSQIKDIENTKANISVTNDIQQQVNNLVLGAVGDGNNAEVVQARGNEKVLNDRLNKIENGENLKSLNIDALKDYTVDILTDISYGLTKATTFTMSGFNGTDLVQIPISNFDITKTYKIVLRFKVISSGRFAFVAYDDTWGRGKMTENIGYKDAGWEGTYIYDLDPSTYDTFALLKLCQVADDTGAQIELKYIKVIETESFAKIDDFDTMFNIYGDIKDYPLVTIKSLPNNLPELLNPVLKIPGTESLKIFKNTSITDYAYNITKPLQVTTTTGDGTNIIQIPTSTFSVMEDSVTVVISYKLNENTTYTRHALKIFDDNWGQGITKDLGTNSVINKNYHVTYTFNKDEFKNFVLFRFVMIGDKVDGRQTVCDINYVKLYNTSEFPGLEKLDELYNTYGDEETYNIIDFKLVPDSLKVKDDSKNVVMIGDSIANQFADVICENNGNNEYNFMNKCIGGESTLDTMARLGAIPYTILPPFTIPADTSNSDTPTLVSSLFVKVDFNQATGQPIWTNGYLSDYNSTGLNPVTPLKCEIAGVKGTLYFTRNVGSTYFKRDTAGEAVTIDRPTNVIPIGTSSYDKNAVYTCFMGTNEGWCNRYFEDGRTQTTATKKDAELLFNYYKLIAQHINTNKFLFMGFYMCAFLDQQSATARNDFWNYFEELMSKEFGNKYFSVRKYLREIGYVDAGVSLVAQDIQDIKDGKIPVTASTGEANGVHVTSRIAACVGNEILKRLKNLGYIDTYNTIDVSKYSNGISSTNPDDFV